MRDLTLPVFVALLAYAVALTLGSFIGGTWAAAGITGAVLLFGATWLRDSEPPAVLTWRKSALAGAAALGLAAVIGLSPLRVVFRLLQPKLLLRAAPVLTKFVAPRLAALALRPPPPRRAEDWRRGLPRPDRGFSILALAAVAAMGLTCPAAANTHVAWHMTLQLASLFLPLLALTAPTVQQAASAPRLFVWLTVVALLAAAALAVELLLGGPLLHLALHRPAPLTDYNRGVSYLVIFAFALTAGLWSDDDKRRRWGLVPLLGLLVLLAVLTESRASKLGLLLALPVMALACWRVSIAAWFLAVLTPLLLFWPSLAHLAYHDHLDWVRQLPPSWQARMEIWDYVSFRITDRPWFGWGLGGSHLLDFNNPDSATYAVTTATAAHPHNAVMQLWVELGVPGLLLGLGLALYSLHRAASLDRRLAIFALGAWVASMVLALCAYDFWTDASWGCFALTGFAFALREKRLRSPAA